MVFNGAYPHSIQDKLLGGRGKGEGIVKDGEEGGVGEGDTEPGLDVAVDVVVASQRGEEVREPVVDHLVLPLPDVIKPSSTLKWSFIFA